MRTVQGRLLLRPSAALNEIVLGVLGRAQRRYAMTIHAASFLSNHFHLLLSPVSTAQMADFMEYLGGNLAREVGRLVGWREKFWARRYRAIVVSNEEEAQIERLAYLLAHGVKEGLVARPEAWPGVHSVRALRDGCVLEGTWFDRTAQYRARQAAKLGREGEGQDPAASVRSSERVVLTALPCWSDLPESAVRSRIVAMVDAIVAQGRRDGRTGRPLGERAILKQHPHQRPPRPERSRALRFHAASGAMRAALHAAYVEFVLTFRDAAERLRRGDLRPRFPPGAFPPPFPAPS